MFSNHFIYSFLASLLITDLHLRCCLASQQTKGPAPLVEHWTLKHPKLPQVENRLFQAVLIPHCPMPVPWDRKVILIREADNINDSLERVLKNSDL